MPIRNTVILVCCLAAVLMLPVAAASTDSGESPPAPPPYAINRADENYEYLRDPARRGDLFDPIKYMPLNASGSWYLSLGGDARERFESFSNPNWGAGPEGSAYFLQRYLFSSDLHMGEHVRVFGQLQSSLESGRTGGPRSSDRDELDAHQLFLDLRFGLPGDGSIVIRPGRQELIYGSQRLIAINDTSNHRKSFDGIRTMLRTGDIRVDAFAAEPVQIKPRVFDDGTDRDRALWGLYSVLPIPCLPGGNADLYYLGYRNRDAEFEQGSARERRHSIGTRIWRTAKPLDYNFEFLYQWGSFGRGDIQAWAAESDTGFTIGALPLHPRLGLKANVMSGDRDPENATLQTFNPLFPTGSYFSEDGLIGAINLMDLNPSLTLELRDDLKLTANWDFFWRESLDDGVYNSSLALVRSGKENDARFVGDQAQVQLDWTVDRHLSLRAIYAHFFTGEFLKETGPADDVDYFTTYMQYRF